MNNHWVHQNRCDFLFPMMHLSSQSIKVGSWSNLFLIQAFLLIKVGFILEHVILVKKVNKKVFWIFQKIFGTFLNIITQPYLTCVFYSQKTVMASFCLFFCGLCSPRPLLTLSRSRRRFSETFRRFDRLNSPTALIGQWARARTQILGRILPRLSGYSEWILEIWRYHSFDR